LILSGLALIVGGYVLAFAARLDWGPGLVLVQRYELVPLVGFSLLLAIAARPWLARCETRPGLVPAALVVLTGSLFVLHAPEIIAQARQYRFPDQVRTLAALDRLAAVCRAKGVTREQAILTLNAFRPKWAYGDPHSLGINPLLMLPETAVRSKVPNAEVRATVWAALTPSDRATLSAGLIASQWLVPLGGVGETETLAVGQLVRWAQVIPQGNERFVTNWRPSFLEYELPAATGPASGPPPRFLYVPGTLPGNVGEVWWSEGDDWHETQSLVWFTDPKAGQAQALRLDQLPQGDWAGVRRIRLVFRMPSIASIGAPRLIR
jgi:hypothetical protein